MDVISALLDRSRATGAFILRSILSPPWSMRIEDNAPLTIVVLTRGSAWIIPDDADATQLHPGDVALIRGPDYHYTVADDVTTSPQVVVDEFQNPADPHGGELTAMSLLGMRSWGNDLHGSTLMLNGTYQVKGEVSESLLRLLPPIAVVAAHPDRSSLIGMLAGEIVRDELGQDTVLDRLLDLLLIATLRSWFSQPGHATGWYLAHGDPVIGPALRLLHDYPARAWTIADLAAEVGVSRAGLARRFHSLVGQPPMAYLTQWRLKLAADLLRESDRTLSHIATAVGYGTAFALSTAFSRERGESPRDYRARTNKQ